MKAENAQNFLEEKLKQLGLNEKETCDFITFWLPILLDNKLNVTVRKEFGTNISAACGQLRSKEV